MNSATNRSGLERFWQGQAATGSQLSNHWQASIQLHRIISPIPEWSESVKVKRLKGQPGPGEDLHQSENSQLANRSTPVRSSNHPSGR